MHDLSPAAIKAIARGWVLGAQPSDVACDVMRDFGYLVDPDEIRTAYDVLNASPDVLVEDVAALLRNAASAC